MKLLSYLLLVIAVLSCEIRPQPINYGSDLCHWCKMSIVDSQHAGQIVTEKGKSFKYDAVECMLNHLKQWDQTTPKLYLVTTFDGPGELIAAAEAHYLISPTIPSPMGEFLTAFEDDGTRQKHGSTEESVLLDWQQLQQEFEVDPVP